MDRMNGASVLDNHIFKLSYKVRRKLAFAVEKNFKIFKTMFN